MTSCYFKPCVWIRNRSFIISAVTHCFQPILSENGLLTTVAYKLGPDQPTIYALEVGTDHLHRHKA